MSKVAYAPLLAPEAEPALLDHLARHLFAPVASQSRRVRTPGCPAPTDVEPFDPAEPVVWSPEVLQRRTLGAVLVLRPPGEPLRLSGFGPVLWPMFEHPTAPADVVEAVAECFSVDVQTAGDGVSEFVQSLLGSGVLHRAHDQDADPITSIGARSQQRRGTVVGPARRARCTVPM